MLTFESRNQRKYAELLIVSDVLVYSLKQFKMATSKTWTRTLDPNPEKLGP